MQKYLIYTKPNTMNRFFLFFFLICSSLNAQFSESWLKNNFESAPKWQGDTVKFNIDSNKQLLLLQAPAEKSQAFISTQSNTINSATWEFSVQMEFNPSSSNYAKIFVVSNSPALDENTEGYYVMIGNTKDEISLWKLKDGQNTKIIDGLDDVTDMSQVSVYIKLTRDNYGSWQLFTGQSSETLTLEGETFDESITESSYFGILCTYTSTRSDKFSFGSIHVSGTPYVDQEPPYISSHSFQNGNTFILYFNENINESSIQKENLVVNEQIHPEDIELNNNILTASFNDYLPDESFGTLNISGIQDIVGNLMNDTTLLYSFNRIKLKELRTVSDASLELTFNKQISIDDIELSALKSNDGLFNFSPTVINDSTILYSSQKAFIPDLEYQFILTGIKSIFGDVIKDTTINCIYRKPRRYDVIISEIMPDPSPAIALPESEYIELFNRQEYPIDLKDWQLIINSKAVNLPDYTLNSKEYVVLINKNEENNWNSFDKGIIFIKSMPALTNSSGTIVIMNSDNFVCDALQYDISNLNQSFKTDGGWSIERKDANNYQASLNWDYSTNLDGGTPGYINANNTDNPDNLNPTILYLSYLSPTEFEIVFNEGMDTSTINQTQIFLDNELIENYEIESTFLDRIKFSLNEELIPRKIYQTHFKDNIQDISGNKLDTNHSMRVGIPETPDSFDICINEVLFNPESEGSDYVEIYNRSDKIINCNDIATANLSAGVPDKLYSIDNKNQLLFPNDYLVICTDTNWIKSKYPIEHSELLQQSSLPSLNDDEGNIAITLKDGQILDYFSYSDDMQFELLRSKEGVSLERINPNLSALNKDNWRSAASTQNFGTPGRQNSQFSLNNINESKQWFNIKKKDFSPDGDGYEDYLSISYQIPNNGWTGSVKIFNRYGTSVKNLLLNQLLDTNGAITWDGTTNSQQLAPPGIYIIYIDLFSSEGKRKQQKLTSVITNGLNP